MLSARYTGVTWSGFSQTRAQARPANRDDDVGRGSPRGCKSEPHLRIPAEYHCRLREQRQTGNNGRVGARGGRVDTVKKKEEEKREKKRKQGREDGGARKRVHCLGRLFVPVSYVSPPPSLSLFLQPHRCIVALSDLRFSRGYPAAPLNSRVTLRTTILHSMYTMTSNDSTRQCMTVYDDAHTYMRAYTRVCVYGF